MSIHVRDIRKTYGSFAALKGVNLNVEPGELLALLGPSGSGKTTLLRIIAGLETPDAGTILFDGRDARTDGTRERRVGFVFQHYALFRHMSVLENVAFGMRIAPRGARQSDAAIRARVRDLLALVQLDGMASRYPDQLSGGQRQRVALARALAVEPRVLLLDEPFGSLDAKVRKELRRWLRKLHDGIHVTSIFVTHDQDEALEVADRVVVMSQGEIEQIGTSEEVYDKPASAFVLEFLGQVNAFHGRVHLGRATFGDIEFDAPHHPDVEYAPAVAYVRPHDIELERAAGDETLIAATLRHAQPVGPVMRLELDGEKTGRRIEVEVTRERYRALALAVGERVYMRPRNWRVFPQPHA
jgi:sulfate transport system ATP-binding protein